MPSFFDNLQKRVFDHAKTTFGYNASYTSADNAVEWEGIVLFMNPTEAFKLAGVPFEPNRYTMEYRRGDLDGLETRVHQRLTEEYVTIDNVVYCVTAVDAIHDGETFRADLVPADLQ